jgi:hypothetical protein
MMLTWPDMTPQPLEMFLGNLPSEMLDDLFPSGLQLEIVV